MYFYSPSTNGFYHPDIHANSIPADAVEVSDERHAELYEAGMSIVASENGHPEIAPPAEPDPKITAARAAAIAHAKNLGFTDEMIAVMYPSLGATDV